MKRLAIAIILLAAAPAVATASSTLMNEVTGQTEVVAESAPTEVSMVSAQSKSSRPIPQRRSSTLLQSPLPTQSTPDWM